jgi:serine/threonine protein kinase
MKQCPICTTDFSDERKTCPTDGAMLMVTSDWSPGTLIRGKYRIIARLGRGGMGTVYKAEHIALEEVRALKVMTPTSDAEFVRRFRQEAQAARRLRHPNVVHVDDLDQADDGSFFIAMDFVDGVSLRQLLQANQGPLPLMRTLGIVRSVADALAAAHALGMVHRDIKPENILLARDLQGRDIPKVLDFGIVAMKECSSTQSTRYLLTPAQGSPEQWKGMKSSELDGRADLYALGVVWYEMLTGRLPLHAHTNEGWMRAHLMEIPQPPSMVNPELAPISGLDALVLKLLAKDREQRPQDAQAFLGELNLIGAQLSRNDGAVATPSVIDNATAMLRSPAKESAFDTPSLSQQGPPPQTPFRAPSIAKTAIYKETSVLGGASTTGSIAGTPAASGTRPADSGFRTNAPVLGPTLKVQSAPIRQQGKRLKRSIFGIIALAVFAVAAVVGFRLRKPMPPSAATVAPAIVPSAVVPVTPGPAETTDTNTQGSPVQPPRANVTVDPRPVSTAAKVVSPRPEKFSQPEPVRSTALVPAQVVPAPIPSASGASAEPSEVPAPNSKPPAIDTPKTIESILPPPTPVTSVDPEAKRIFDEAQAKLRAKDYENAAALFETASKLRPNWNEPLVERAKINAKLGRFAETIADCTQALRLDPSDPVALYFRGYAKLSMHQLKDAISDFDEAIRLKPDYHDAYESRGNAKWAMQDKLGAKADFDMAHSLQNPNTKR